MFEELRKRIARAVIIDRATGTDSSLIDRIARARSEENYRFAAQFVAGKSVLDVGGGTGIGHGFLLEKKPNRILSLDKKISPQQGAGHGDLQVEYRRRDFFEVDLPDMPPISGRRVMSVSPCILLKNFALVRVTKRDSIGFVRIDGDVDDGRMFGIAGS